MHYSDTLDLQSATPQAQFTLMSTPLFECNHLLKRYGDNTVVNDVSFSIAPGECLGVIGPNGAGKTTTLRMCLGLSQPDGGDIRAFGLSMPDDALAIKARLGVVTQTSPAPKTSWCLAATLE
jgi:lipooligosaccharide transport system ATP-binding protein